MKTIDIIKELDSNYIIPPYPKPPYNDDDPVFITRRANINKLESTIEELCESFRVHLFEELKDDVYKNLDYSVDSLKLLDMHFYKTDYPNNFTKDYLNNDFIPLLWAYISKSVFHNIVPIGNRNKISWKYSNSVKKHLIQPNSGGRLFNPYEYAELVVYSGFRIYDFYRVVHDYCYLYEIVDEKSLSPLLSK